jgi:N-methylhydantoinase A/oxoprolinase/acetone carboxylase beta subunit
MRKPKSKKFKIAGKRKPSPDEVRPVYFGAGRALQTPVFRRQALAPGVRIKGPAVMEEKRPRSWSIRSKLRESTSI